MADENPKYLVMLQEKRFFDEQGYWYAQGLVRRDDAEGPGDAASISREVPGNGATPEGDLAKALVEWYAGTDNFELVSAEDFDKYQQPAEAKTTGEGAQAKPAPETKK